MSKVTDILKVVDDIIERNFRGYKIRYGDDWYEVSVHACEPPDTHEILVDADTP